MRIVTAVPLRQLEQSLQRELQSVEERLRALEHENQQQNAAEMAGIQQLRATSRDLEVRRDFPAVSSLRFRARFRDRAEPARDVCRAVACHAAASLLPSRLPSSLPPSYPPLLLPSRLPPVRE